MPMLRLALVFNSRRPRARLLLSVIGIALGVALGYAVHLVNRAAVADVAAAVRAVAGGADIEVRGGRSGFPESLYATVARLPGVSIVSPVLELDAGIAGTESTLHVVGVDILRAALLQPALAIEDRYELLAPDKVFLSAAAAAALELAKGERLRLVVGQQALELTVAGVLSGSVLRVLGLDQAGVARLVLVEAAALGVVGAALGIALGYALALLAVRTWGADLGAGMFRDLHPHLGFSFPGALFYFIAGIAVAVLGALLPARDAGRTPAARALKAGDEQVMFTRASSALPGVALLLISAALAQLGPVRGLPVYGYAAIACLLVGAVALMPRLSRAVFDALPLPRAPGLALALAQLRAAPGQAAVSLAAIVASFSLMAAMAIMVSSFRQSVDDWLGTVLPAQVYFRTTHAGDTGVLDPAFVERVRSLPQIARIDFLRSGRVVLDAARPSVVLIARDRAALAFPLVEKMASLPARAIWVSEAVRDVYGFHAGDVVELPLLGRNYRLPVAGVFRDYARQHGAILIDRAQYVALTGDDRVNDGAVWLAPGAT